MWNCPRPGIEPMSPALAGRFSSTVWPGKSYDDFLYSVKSDSSLTPFFPSLCYLCMDAGETFPVICVWMIAVVWTRFWQKYSERREVLRKSEPPRPELLLSPRATVTISFFPSFLLYLFFWPHHEACGILVPQPGVKHTSCALEVWRLNNWTIKEVLWLFL